MWKFSSGVQILLRYMKVVQEKRAQKYEGIKCTQELFT
jgi:hypothetical protein